ncbi:MAG: hypothetical protein AAF957_07090 [Planctomycetota bacterium]
MDPAPPLDWPPFALEPPDLAPLDLVALAGGVHTTPLLTERGCARLSAEIEERRARLAAALRTSDARQPPNSMHAHGAMLGPLGLDGVVDALRERLAPDLARLYPEVGGESLDGHHSYLVEYGRDLDEDLGFHVDDSEVTLNLCLGETFSGAELVLLGRRCALHRQDPVEPGETLEIDHEPGVCVLHAGWHRHRVDPILRGERRNLIAWLRSSAHRAREEAQGGGCRPWCARSEP